MSNCQNKTVTRGSGWIAFVTYIIVVAAVLGIIFGVKGIGSFNTASTLDNTKTLTVSVNQTIYENDLDKIEAACEEAFGDLKVSYQLKGEMSGDESEIVYAFAEDTKLSDVEKALETKFAAMTSDEGELKGSFITVAVNSEKSLAYIAENYALRGVIAGLVMIALVYVYAAIRFGIGKGVAVAFGTFYGLGLTVAIVLLTRIPVTASISYVFAAAALLSAIASVLSMNKIAASEKSEDCSACACASKEIMPICLLLCFGLIVLAVLGTQAVTSFALTSLISVIVATMIGLKGVPSLYAPIKVAAERRPVKGGYVGAVKTSTKEKEEVANEQ